MISVSTCWEVEDHLMQWNYSPANDLAAFVKEPRKISFQTDTVPYDTGAGKEKPGKPLEAKKQYG